MHPCTEHSKALPQSSLPSDSTLVPAAALFPFPVPSSYRSNIPYFLFTLFPVCLHRSPSPPGRSFHQHLHVFCKNLDAPSSFGTLCEKTCSPFLATLLCSCPGETSQGQGCSWLHYTCPPTKIKRSNEKLSVVLSNTSTYL